MGFFTRHWKALGTAVVLAASALAFNQKSEMSPEQAALEEFAGRGPVAASVSGPNEPGEPNNPAETRKTLRVYERFEDPNYAMWDLEIIEDAAFWNDMYDDYNDLPGYELLSPEDYKRLCLYECRGNPRAFRHNPPQFGNEGDPGFFVMRDGLECGIPKGGWPELKGYIPIPRKTKIVKGKNGKKRKVRYWDFDAEGIIPPRKALWGGAGWLWHKNCVYGEVVIESGPIMKYKVEEDDSLWEIGRKFDTVPESILRHTSLEDPNNLSVGQVISYKAARKAFLPVRFRGWLVPDGGADRYNGGGDSNYLAGIKGIEPSEN